MRLNGGTSTSTATAPPPPAADPPRRTTTSTGPPGRRAAVVLLVLSSAVLAAWLAVALRLPDTDAEGSDYSAFHVAALLVREGQAGQLYDQGAETRRHEQLVPPGYHVDLPYISPPATVLLVLPLTGLALPTAFRVAGIAEFLLLAGAVAVAVRAAPRSPSGRPDRIERLAIGAMATAGVGTLVLVLMGQWDGLLALGVALAYACLRRRQPLAAGLALGLTLAPTKPHLALGLLAFLVGLRAGRALGGIALAGVATLLADLAVAGPSGVTGWLGALRLSSGHSPLASLLGTTGFAGSWLGDTTAAHAVGLALAVPAVAGCAVLGHALRRGRVDLEVAMGGAVALGLLAAPHLLMHDLAVLAPAAAWTMVAATARSERSGRRAVAGWLALNVVCLLDLGAASVGPPGRVTPVALAVAGVLAVRLALRSPQSGRGSGVGGVVLQS